MVPNERLAGCELDSLAVPEREIVGRAGLRRRTYARGCGFIAKVLWQEIAEPEL